eukprot:TRINITY_DN315_c1_g3_i3.p1 TRINITY_DN315_c1_g3~~TRINITY_DN315_c1_g3_i3.p1  ORF type:complete len:301 (-),score=18.24 TRINITY_DN315_c1_g3_i3:79-981(-)
MSRSLPDGLFTELQRLPFPDGDNPAGMLSGDGSTFVVHTTNFTSNLFDFAAYQRKSGAAPFVLASTGQVPYGDSQPVSLSVDGSTLAMMSENNVSTCSVASWQCSTFLYQPTAQFNDLNFLADVPVLAVSSISSSEPQQVDVGFWYLDGTLAANFTTTGGDGGNGLNQVVMSSDATVLAQASYCDSTETTTSITVWLADKPWSWSEWTIVPIPFFQIARPFQVFRSGENIVVFAPCQLTSSICIISVATTNACDYSDCTTCAAPGSGCMWCLGSGSCVSQFYPTCPDSLSTSKYCSSSGA